jgi:hypothetical protein
MIDAEQSYFQSLIDIITLEMSKEFNTHQATVFATIQCYLKDGDARTKWYVDGYNRNGIFGAIKLVRGAYINEEQSIGPDIVHDSKPETDACYDRNLAYVIEQMKPGWKLCVATHNEQSIDTAI